MDGGGPPQSAAASSHKDLLMVSLSRFYAHKTNMQRVLPYITGTSEVSLRLIDWFVTNYAKRYNTVLLHAQPGAGGGVVHFNVYLMYRAQLKAFSKQQFDPFRRRDRVQFYYERSKCVDTTLGQLNFFRWAIVHGVIEYGQANAAEIEDDMMASIRHRGQHPAAAAAARRARDSPADSPDPPAPDEKPRRKELSRAAVKSCTRTRVRVVFRFK